MGKVEFTKDKWGWYITPLIGIDWLNYTQIRFWLGWGRWLWTWSIKSPRSKRFEKRLLNTMKRAHEDRIAKEIRDAK